MILGRTRRGVRIVRDQSADVRDRALLVGGPQRAVAVTAPAGPLAAENETEGTMKIGVINMPQSGMNQKMCQHRLHHLALLKSQLVSTNPRLRSR